MYLRGPVVHNGFKDLGCDHLETPLSRSGIRPEPMLELLPDDPLDLVLRGGANDPREDRRDLRVVLIRVLAEVDPNWVVPEEDGLDLFVQTVPGRVSLRRARKPRVLAN